MKSNQVHSKYNLNRKCIKHVLEKGKAVPWYGHCGKQYGGVLKKLKIELPYDPAILLLGIYLERLKTLI